VRVKGKNIVKNECFYFDFLEIFIIKILLLNHALCFDKNLSLLLLLFDVNVEKTRSRFSCHVFRRLGAQKNPKQQKHDTEKTKIEREKKMVRERNGAD